MWPFSEHIQKVSAGPITPLKERIRNSSSIYPVPPTLKPEAVFKKPPSMAAQRAHEAAVRGFKG